MCKSLSYNTEDIKFLGNTQVQKVAHWTTAAKIAPRAPFSQHPNGKGIITVVLFAFGFKCAPLQRAAFKNSADNERVRKLKEHKKWEGKKRERNERKQKKKKGKGRGYNLSPLLFLSMYFGLSRFRSFRALRHVVPCFLYQGTSSTGTPLVTLSNSNGSLRLTIVRVPSLGPRLSKTASK